MRLWILIVCGVVCGLTRPAWAQAPTEPAAAQASDISGGAYAGEMPDITPTYLQSPDVRQTWNPEHVDDFSLTDQTGQTVTLDDLKGRPWVANFVFTRCVTQCPTMCGEIRKLLSALNTDPAKPNPVRFVTITIDPRHDSLEKIKEFAKIFGAERDEWLFLTGNEKQITELVRHGFKVAAWENFGTDRLPGMEFAHSMHLIHVDEAGKILGRYESLNIQDLNTLQRVLEGKIETPQRHKPALAVALPPADPLANLPAWAKRLPATNATLNALATLLLLTGFVAIKAKNITLHKRLMLSTFVVSIVFLSCYLTYHFALNKYTGEHGKRFVGTPSISKVYYSILITHVILAVTVPFLASITIWKGLKGNWDSHRRWAKVTFPIWLYVSVTGVIIYWMLYHASGPVA